MSEALAFGSPGIGHACVEVVSTGGTTRAVRPLVRQSTLPPERRLHRPPATCCW